MFILVLFLFRSRNELTEWQSKQVKVACTLSIIGCFIKEYEVDIDVDLKLLNEITEELENAVVRFRRNFKPEQGEVTKSRFKIIFILEE